MGALWKASRWWLTPAWKAGWWLWDSCRNIWGYRRSQGLAAPGTHQTAGGAAPTGKALLQFGLSGDGFRMESVRLLHLLLPEAL